MIKHYMDVSVRVSPLELRSDIKELGGIGAVSMNWPGC
jgi:hypothetical protein